MKETDYPIEMLSGWPFAAVTEDQCVSYILREIREDRGGWVVTANLDLLRRLVRDGDFAALCGQASFIVADGMPLIWASWIQGSPLPERVAGSSLISALSAGAAKHACSVFLLGGKAGTAEAAAEVLSLHYPNLQVAGTCCPRISRNLEENEREIERIVDQLKAARPDIVYVALGSPKQEILINRLRPYFPGTWWLGVGISFSYLCGRIRRPPGWVRQSGLEWLYRLVQEPRRLAWRYLVNDFPFGVSLLIHAALIGIRRRRFGSAGARQ